MTLLVVLAMLQMLEGQSPGGSEGYRERSLSLNGPWEFVVGEGDEGAETPHRQADLDWRPNP